MLGSPGTVERPLRDALQARQPWTVAAPALVFLATTGRRAAVTAGAHIAQICAHHGRRHHAPVGRAERRLRALSLPDGAATLSDARWRATVVAAASKLSAAAGPRCRGHRSGSSPPSPAHHGLLRRRSPAKCCDAFPREGVNGPWFLWGFPERPAVHAHPGAGEVEPAAELIVGGAGQPRAVEFDPVAAGPHAG